MDESEQLKEEASPSSPNPSMGSNESEADVQHQGLFSRRHVELVCENLIGGGKYDRLDRFLWAVPNLEDYSDIEIVLIAQAYIAFRSGKFERLYKILQKRVYSKRYHHQLQYLWRTARYIEAEKVRGRALGSVGKYRIRRKHPLPYTIWDGECMSYCFREEARDLLNKAYATSAYPNATEKYEIAQSTNLTVTQVSNWFKNKRQRARAKKIDNQKDERVDSPPPIPIEKNSSEISKNKSFEEYPLHDTKTIEDKKITTKSIQYIPAIKVPYTPIPIVKVPYTRPVIRVPYAHLHTPYITQTHKLYQPVIYKRSLQPLIYRADRVIGRPTPYRRPPSPPGEISSYQHYEKSSTSCKCNCNRD